MSTKQIIAELEHLSPEELRRVQQRARELERQKAAGKYGRSWREALLEVAGTCEGLPPDFAINHDHYLHGTPKQAP